MAEIKVKFKMTPEQKHNLLIEYECHKQFSNHPFKTFEEFLDWKFKYLIDKKIDEVCKCPQDD